MPRSQDQAGEWKISRFNEGRPSPQTMRNAAADYLHTMNSIIFSGGKFE
jgi:hypothetical protein